MTMKDGGDPPNTSCGQTHIWGPSMFVTEILNNARQEFMNPMTWTRIKIGSIDAL